MLTNPNLLIIDEAFTALDFQTKTQMQNLFLELHEKRKFTAVIVTHDLMEALILGDYIYVLHGQPINVKVIAIVELKQNYGTPFIMQYGNIMRAGDAPFDLETNYQRTLHVQSYTPFALNDYQTFTKFDTKEDVACAIIKMLAAGVPAYGMNIKNFNEDVRATLRYHNELYVQNITVTMEHRVPQNSANTIMAVEGIKTHFVFMLPIANQVNILKETLIFNGSYSKKNYIKNSFQSAIEIVVKDCLGIEQAKLAYSAEIIEIDGFCFSKSKNMFSVAIWTILMLEGGIWV